MKKLLILFIGLLLTLGLSGQRLPHAGVVAKRITTVATPAMPSGLTLTLISGGVNASWTDNSGGTAQTEVWGSNSTGTETLLYTITAGTVTKDDAAVTPVDLRYYKVRAKNGALYSSYTSEVSIAMLGSELINQSTWYTSAFWNTFNANFSQSGTTLVMSGGNGDVRKSSMFTVGWHYRLIITAVITSGSGNIQDNGTYWKDPFNASGTFTVNATAADTQFIIHTGASLAGTISALSIKRILSP